MSLVVKDSIARAARLPTVQGLPSGHSLVFPMWNISPVRFNRIAWGKADGSRPEGVIVAGMESGEIGIWDPSKIVANAKYVFSSLFDGKSDTITTALPRLSYSRIPLTPDPFVD
jgi:hypothetical protein